jgi:selenide,water dikinase
VNVPRDLNVLVGFGTLDDAGIYRLNDRQALVQTVDFITPVVDDPYTYGEIAVVNALSDVYAMGGLPLTALNVVCFPSGLDMEILNAILRGGLAKCLEAGVALMGGHTVDDPEIKYGLSVTGTIDPEHIWTNAGAQVGDVLVLTKPVGVGAITTGIKQGVASEAATEAVITSMRTLNRVARDVAATIGPHACTDVTGFSLLGHLYQMMRASGMTATVQSSQVPFLMGALELARQGVTPGGTERNKVYFGENVSVPASVESAVVDLLFDPQTSGGLLLAVSGDKKVALLTALTERGVAAAVIGTVTEPSAGHVRVI